MSYSSMLAQMNPDQAVAAGFHHYARHRDHLGGLKPVLENEIAQLSPGSPDVASIIACGRDLFLGRAFTAPKQAGNVVYHPDWLFIMLPLSWKGDYVFNGHLAARYDVFLCSSRDGYAFSGEKRDLLGVAVRKRSLSITLRALSGHVHDDFAVPDQRVTLGEWEGTALRRDLLAGIAVGGGRRGGKGRVLLPEVAEGHLICRVAQALLPHLERGADVNSGKTDPRRVVRRALEAFERQPPERVSLQDLCESAGVSKAFLHKCFVELYGVSPMVYQRARRLEEARAMLLDRDSPPRSVKDVSLSLGFFNGGRFAADYSAIFGERPSETFSADSARWRRSNSHAAALRQPE